MVVAGRSLCDRGARRFQVLLSSRFPTFHALYCRETCERRTALFLGFAQAHSELTHAVASFASLNTATSIFLSRPHSTQWLLPWATKASWRGPRSWSVEMAGISSRNRSKRLSRWHTQTGCAHDSYLAPRSSHLSPTAYSESPFRPPISFFLPVCV